MALNIRSEREVASQENMLKQLKRRFSGDKAAGLCQFLLENEIPFESWSRIGD